MTTKERLEKLTKEAVMSELSQSFLNGRELLGYDEVLNVVKEVVKNCSIPDVSERFSSEERALEWVKLHTPFAIKPKSKQAKTLFVNAFTSTYAFEEVCKYLARKLHNAR